MKQLIQYLCLAVLLTSCVQYRYHLPQTNTVLFKNEGEIHVSGDIGSSATSIKAAYALNEKVGLTAMYNSSFGQDFSAKYLAWEAEFGAGLYKPADPTGLFVQAGMGFGSNAGYTDSTLTVKSYEGNIFRPFVQLNAGVSTGTLIGGLKGSLIFSLKLNTFIYDGRHLDGTNDRIRSTYLLAEPAITLGLGSRHFQFEYFMGVPFRPTPFNAFDSRSNAITFPLTVGIGLHFIFGRD